MSPPRRRSARLASTQKSTRAFPELQSVNEHVEPTVQSSPRRRSAKSPRPAPSTPPSSAIKPPRSEMHPSKFHNSIGEPSSAVALGFIDIETSDRRKSGAGLAGTPSKSSGVPSTSFTFDLASTARTSSLGSDARNIMNELKEKAAKIKKELVAQREADNSITERPVGERHFAKPKSIAGRYSAAHQAEFEKMDSIEGHPSAWRASRFTPVVASVKRSPSKTSLNNSPCKSPTTRSLDKQPSVDSIRSKTSHKNLKRKSSAANLDSSRHDAESPGKRDLTSSPTKTSERTTIERQPMKRIKQHKDDDTSTSKSRLAMMPTTIPRTPTRPQSTLSRLISSTKSSRLHKATILAKTPSPVKPAIRSALTPIRAATVSPRKPVILESTPSRPKDSPIKAQAPSMPSFSQSLASGSLTVKTDGIARRILSPMRMQKVKSILRSQPDCDSAVGSAIPQPALYGSLTPGSSHLGKELPPIPFTTPRRKLAKKVTFTPETKRAAAEQNSPSPLKSCVFKFGSASRPKSTRGVEMKNAAALDLGGHVAYPDLSAFKHILDSGGGGGKKQPELTPGSFTFRSDHTIQFSEAPETGFGSSAGQASVRHVRESLNESAPLPGSFPTAAAPRASGNTDAEDKENTAPASAAKVLPGVLHGLTRKKRNRPNSDEEDAEREAAERASKKRKHGAAERPALSSAKAIHSTPQSSSLKRARLDRNNAVTPRKQPGEIRATTPATAGSAKRRGGMSMSRLNALARPKARA